MKKVVLATALAILAATAPLLAVVAQQQTGSAGGVDSSGYPYSGHWWITPSADSVTFATHKCGTTTLTVNLPEQVAACTLEQCMQGYLEEIAGGGDMAACGPTDTACCFDASRWTASCLATHYWGDCG